MSTAARSAFRSTEEMRAHLTQKAMENPEFRSQLTADPRATISKEFDIEIPDNLDIQVHESDMRTVHLALPPSTELNEEQLEAIAAGLCCC